MLEYPLLVHSEPAVWEEEKYLFAFFDSLYDDYREFARSRGIGPYKLHEDLG